MPRAHAQRAPWLRLNIVPRGPVEIDWSHPLARGLQCFYIPGVSLGDIAKRLPPLAPATTGQAGFRPSPAGLGWGSTTTSPSGLTTTGGATFPSSFSVSNGLTIWAHRHRVGTPSGSANWTVGINNASDTRTFIVYSDANTNTLNVVGNAGFQAISGNNTLSIPNDVHTVAASWSGSNGPPALYYRGASLTLTSSSNISTLQYTQSTDYFLLGQAANETVLAGALWDRPLSADEIAWLEREPYAIVRPVKRFIRLGSTSPATGALTATQASQTISATGGPRVSGSLAAAQAAQTISASAAISVSASLSSTQAANALSAAAGVLASGALTATQSVQTISAAGTVVVSGTLAAAQATQTLSAAASTAVIGALATAQAAQTLTGAGGPIAVAALAATQASQTLTSIASTGNGAALNATQAAQTISAAGGPRDTATLTATQSAQTLSAAGGVRASAALAATQGGQSIAAAATVRVSGALAGNQAAQTIAAAGSLSVSAALTATQMAQAVSSAGAIGLSGTLAATQASQTLSAAATLGILSTATLAIKSQDQTTWSTSRSSIATYFDAAGVLQVAGPGYPRPTFSGGVQTGYIAESAATNLVANSSTPSSWNFYGGSGITNVLSSTGVENGISYGDFAISGTNSSGSSAYIGIQFVAPGGSIAITSGGTYTDSVYAKLVSQTALPAAGIGLQCSGIDVSDSYTETFGSLTLNTTLAAGALGSYRPTSTGTSSNGATVAAIYLLQVVAAAGETVNFVVRLGLPQFETGSAATSVIPTSGSSLTRGADAPAAAALGGPVASGALAATQAGQTISATAIDPLAASLSRTQASQTLTATASLQVSATSAIAQATQTLSGTASVGVSGTLSEAQANNGLAGVGGSVVSGALSATQGGQSFSGIAAARVSGTLAVTEAGDTLTATGGVFSGIAGSLAATQASQTVSSTATLYVSGALTSVQSANTVVATAAVVVSGVLSKTATGDALAGTAVAVALGPLTAGLQAVQERQGVFGRGNVQVAAHFGLAQSAQSIVARGEIILGVAVGHLAGSQQTQRISAQGFVFDTPVPPDQPTEAGVAADVPIPTRRIIRLLATHAMPNVKTQRTVRTITQP